MGKSYSQDIRSRVIKAVALGSSRRSAAERFGVSISSAIRWTSRAGRTGTTAPDPQGRRPGSGKLSAYLAYLIGEVEAEPDITMPELVRRLEAEHGVIVSPASLSRVLCQAGFTYKKTADGIGMRTRRRR